MTDLSSLDEEELAILKIAMLMPVYDIAKIGFETRETGKILLAVKDMISSPIALQRALKRLPNGESLKAKYTQLQTSHVDEASKEEIQNFVSSSFGQTFFVLPINERYSKVAAILDDNFPADEALAFKRLIFFVAEETAQMSGGGILGLAGEESLEEGNILHRIRSALRI